MSDDTSADELGTENGSDNGAGGNSRDEGLQTTDTSGGSGGGAHPSQAEGEDPNDPPQRPDPDTDGHPSQAEGEGTGSSGS